MSELLGRLQTGTFARATAATAVRGGWVEDWIRLTAERLHSYAADGALP